MLFFGERKRVLILIGFHVLSAEFTLSFSQVQANVSYSLRYSHQTKEFFELSVINSSSQPIDVFISVRIEEHENNDKYVEFRSSPVSIKPGYNRLNSQSLTVEWFDKKPSSSITASEHSIELETGQYTVCTWLTPVGQDIELWTQCNEYSVVAPAKEEKPSLLEKLGSSKFYRQVDPHAKINLAADNGYFYFPYSEAGNITLDMAASARLAGYPVTGSIYYSTYQENLDYKINKVAFGFDAASFRKILTEKLQNKLNAEKDSALTEMRDYRSKLQQLSNMEKVLSDSSLLSEFEGLGELDKVKEELNKKSKQFDPGRMADLQRQFDKLPVGARDTSQIAKELVEMKKMRAEIEILHKQLDKLNQIAARKKEFDRLMEKASWLQQSTDEITGRMEEQKNDLLSQNKIPDLTNPAEIKRQMEERGMLKGISKYMYDVRDFKIGVAQPIPRVVPIFLSHRWYKPAKIRCWRGFQKPLLSFVFAPRTSKR